MKILSVMKLFFTRSKKIPENKTLLLEGFVSLCNFKKIFYEMCKCHFLSSNLSNFSLKKVKKVKLTSKSYAIILPECHSFNILIARTIYNN